jgi:hypothetical protein
VPEIYSGAQILAHTGGFPTPTLPECFLRDLRAPVPHVDRELQQGHGRRLRQSDVEHCGTWHLDVALRRARAGECFELAVETIPPTSEGAIREGAIRRARDGREVVVSDARCNEGHEIESLVGQACIQQPAVNPDLIRSWRPPLSRVSLDSQPALAADPRLSAPRLLPLRAHTPGLAHETLEHGRVAVRIESEACGESCVGL